MIDARIPIDAPLSLDPNEVKISFIRAGGPGGQNVNKVASAVQLRFDVVGSPSLSEPIKRRLLVLAGRRATKDGVLVITAQAHRTQERNRADAVARLIELIRRASVMPKTRVPTKATRTSRERRLRSKSRRAEVKSTRRRIAGDDY
jgi:ribosome-associated protein